MKPQIGTYLTKNGLYANVSLRGTSPDYPWVGDVKGALSYWSPAGIHQSSNRGLDLHVLVSPVFPDRDPAPMRQFDKPLLSGDLATDFPTPLDDAVAENFINPVPPDPEYVEREKRRIEAERAKEKRDARAQYEKRRDRAELPGPGEKPVSEIEAAINALANAFEQFTKQAEEKLPVIEFLAPVLEQFEKDVGNGDFEKVYMHLNEIQRVWGDALGVYWGASENLNSELRDMRSIMLVLANRALRLAWVMDARIKRREGK